MALTHHIVVRRFAEADADELAALIRTTLLTSNAADYTSSELEGLADWYAAGPLISRLTLADRLVAVATHDHHSDEIVGTAARRENRLEGFFVHPDWQRGGVGSQLLDALESAARREAMRVLWLESSVTSVGFYERKGYTPAGAPRDNGDGVVVGMRKLL